MDDDKHFAIRASVFEQNGAAVIYRQQMNLIRPDGYAGELRGFYPESNTWNPPASRQGKTRSGGHKQHGGVDIYAPYIAFPCEVPVYAFVTGRLEIKSMARQPDDNGHRILLYPDKAELPEHMPGYFILAHLSRFNGRVSGRVKAGEIIGYAGYSGNAGQSDLPPEDSSKLHINSGHVHFQIPPNPHQLNPLDPLEKLGWKLRFDAGTDTLKTGVLANGSQKDIAQLFKSTAVEDLVKLGVAKNNPDMLQRTRGLLRSDTLLPPALKALRKPSDPPNTLDYTSRQALQKTKAAYERINGRFETITPAWREKYFKRCSDRLRNDLKEVDSLKQAMRAHALDFTAKRQQHAGQHATALLRLVFDGYQVVYRLMGGSALASVAAGSTLPKKTGVTITQEMKEANLGDAPDCGIGICGEAYALALDNAVGALHHVQLRERINATEFKIRPQRTLSISFGQGTEWHAVLDDLLFTAAPNDLIWLAESARDLASALRHLSAVMCVCIKALNEGRPGAGSKDFELADKAVSQVLVHLDNLDGPIKTLVDEKWATYRVGQEVKVQKLMQLIARTSLEACTLALKTFDDFEGSPGFKPAVTRLWLVPPD